MSWIKQGIGFAVMAFILMVLFIVISRPFTMIVDTVQNESNDNLNSTTVDHSITPFLTTLRTVFGLVFVLGFFSLLFGLFLKAHENEYEEYPEDYRRFR
jgi:uncharacterized BrkB/YihY/UPF0761 family membrane protein